MNRALRSPRLLGVLLFLMMGIVKLPLENHLSHSLRDQKLIPNPPALSLRDSLGQMGFAATLGGLRSLVASITYLQAYVAFERVEWGKVDSLMTLTTLLQPLEPSYWDEASWHMAYNAASNYLNDEKIRAALRQKLFRDHVQRGINILNEGLKFLPNHPRLLIKLGDIYNTESPARRSPDGRKAAEYYLAAHANGAQGFYERIAAYELAKFEDRPSQQQAYDILKRYYDQDTFNPTMRRLLPELEEKLQIPAIQRIDPQRPFSQPGRRTLRR
ncbi:hypothetical protein FEM03_07830 [Phragmitibacter flavus]|uniref:Tetratricopeptide repeat protein n=1 Tax=Phragmitibacter flavus TaxID=2576071 RepID=A0A5R8KGQ6_9BACT|nr:hypothetical protein [Phragmitibacter flavus]TLD71427.1 hypothetical protein FEM03_07830 [Phragmitibacter flavus]